MSKAVRIVGVIVLLVVAVFAGWRYYQAHRAREAGIIAENISHDGDAWTADMTARVTAPEDSVYNAIRDVQNTRSDQVKAVRVVSDSGNTKVVDMDLNGPGGQPITTRLQFEYDPANHRITYHTLDNPMLSTDAEYTLDDEGGSTLIKLHETTKFTQSLPVPDGVIKDVIRGIFVSQLEGLKRTLHVDIADKTNEDDTGF
jgi:uncharacterized membrane protein